MPRSRLVALFGLLSLAIVVGIALVGLPRPSQAQENAATLATVLQPGFNLVGWLDTDAPVSEVVDGLGGRVDRFFGWDPAADSFTQYRAGALLILNTLDTLVRGQGYWLLVNGAGPVTWTRLANAALLSVPLSVGFNLAVWGGPDGTPVTEAVASLGGALLAVYIFDPAGGIQAYDRRLPLRLRSEFPLRTGAGMWVQMVGSASWEQPAAVPNVVVRIGSVFPLSGGGLASFGISEMNGVRLAVEMINNGEAVCVEMGMCEPGGGFIVGDTLYTIELVERDTRSNGLAGITATAELVRDEGVKFIFGPLPEDLGLAVQEITQPEKVLHLMGLSILSSPDGVLTPETAQGDKKWLFQTEPGELVRSTVTAAGALELLGAQQGESSAILVIDDPYGRFLGELYNEVLAALGQQTFDVVYYPPGTSDFSPFLVQIRALEPVWMHIFSNVADSVVIAEQALELQLARGYMVFGAEPGWWRENFATQNEVPIVVTCITLCRDVPSSERAAEFFDRLNLVECPPDGVCEPAPIFAISLFTYDYVFMLVRAMEIAGTVDDTTAIADALEDLRYDGVLGPLSFDESHVALHGLDACLVLQGEIACKHFPVAEYGPEALGVDVDPPARF